MSAGRVSRIQRRYEENIRQNNNAFSNTSRQQSQQSQQPSWRQSLQQRQQRLQQQQQQQQQEGNGDSPQATWGDSMRNGFTTLREVKPVQGLTSLVTETIPKATNRAWMKCGMDTTWEEFNFGNNPFQGGNGFFEDFNGDMIDDDSIVERDPFDFPIKPNQPSSRRKEEVPTGWANFNSPHFEAQAVRYYSPTNATATTAGTSSTMNTSIDDSFYDHGEKMFDVKAVPITEVIPIHSLEPPSVLLSPQMLDPDQPSDEEPEGDEEVLMSSKSKNKNNKGSPSTKAGRFNPFGGGFRSTKPVAVVVEKAAATEHTKKQARKEEERLRKKEEQRLQEIREEKAREEERIRRKEALLKREEERLAREQERILQEEERMMREEEERERRRDERRRREIEIARLKEERRERELRKREDFEFERIEQTRQKSKSDDGGLLEWEDVELGSSFESVEVDWQGFPPALDPALAASSPPRRQSRKRERREGAPRAPREPRESIKIECPGCPPLCCRDFCANHKKSLFGLVILLLVAGLFAGIYFALDMSGALEGVAEEDPLNPDCVAVLGGFAIPNESLYPTVRLSWVMDISSEGAWASMPALTSITRTHFQDMVIPTLAGCMGTPPSSDGRYDILNGYVRSVRDVGSCRVGEPQPCARVLVDFVVYVRGESSVLDLISHISAQYNTAVAETMDQMENVRQTGLVGLFEQRT
ncbi:unnamed protein product [Cylindrotheca closterium]|uniref:Uncharacterized protein n=1 Tax=Cylindrotheca closterium TaxID=2856 RepID=A0AAD2CM94_9STRA|nr:unnamed protein product [Cylindrotheca closterium]